MDIGEVIAQPFKELVETATEAVRNAETAQNVETLQAREMLRVARAAVREGHRAQGRIRRLWTSEVARHGDVFVETMDKNYAVVCGRQPLEDILYDLDDFVELGTFEVSRFQEVQAASKTLALLILETIKTLQMPKAPSEDPQSLPPSPSSSVMTTMSRRPLPPLPPLKPGRMTSRPTTAYDSFLAETGYPGPPPRLAIPKPPIPARSTRRPQSMLSADVPRLAFSITEAISDEIEASLTPRALSPRTAKAESKADSLTVASPTMPALRTTTWLDEQDEMPESARGQRYTLGSSRHASSVFDRPTSSATTAATRMSSFSVAHGSFSVEKAPAASMYANSLPTPPPESKYEHLLHPVPPVPTIEGVDMRPSRPTQADRCAIGPESSLYQLGGMCEGSHEFRRRGYRHGTKQCVEYVRDPSQDRPPAEMMGDTVQASSMIPGTKKLVAKCFDCEYRQNGSDLHIDFAGEASANFAIEGVVFRRRFLFKSHLASTVPGETIYGCVFCEALGQTTGEDDATAFDSLDQLFRHLSQHAQPLPAVPHFKVLYGTVSMNDPNYEDYDLHFPDPPADAQMSEVERAYVARLPAAKAISSFVPRLLTPGVTDPDGSVDDILSFFVGSRITGIEFPERWGGEWCVGWHDGVRGSFPARTIAVQHPSKGEVDHPDVPQDGVTLRARWKWEPRDNSSDWLSFDKGDVIENARWTRGEQWCWSGTTKDGRVGFFPQSHVEPESVQGPRGSPTKGNLAKKRSRATRILGMRMTNTIAPVAS